MHRRILPYQTLQNHPAVNSPAKRYCRPKVPTTPQGGDPAENLERYNDRKKPEKRPLQVDNLYFQWGRTQLRDPRLTSGRQCPFYYNKSNDIPVDLLERLQQIYKSERPKGRLTNTVKNDIFVAESNPWESFYDINQCHDKGRD